MIRPRTVVYFMHFPADPTKEGTGDTYERSGELVASEQLTSFVRDSAVKFWAKLQAEKYEAA